MSSPPTSGSPAPLLRPAFNYGANGYVIGHEITYGFDLVGSYFDADGNLANWWADEDRAQVLALNEAPGASTAVRAAPVAPVAMGPPFTPEQRFFIAAASVWRNTMRPGFLELLVRSGTHAPGSVRATQPLRNADPFFLAFGIEPGDPMWLPPEERIVIW